MTIAKYIHIHLKYMKRFEEPKSGTPPTTKIKKRRSAPGPLGDFFIVSFKNSVSFYLVKKIRKLPSIWMTKKKVHHKFEIAFNFKKEIPLKCFLSPLGDTLSPLGIVPFYVRNPFKIHLEQKKSSPKY